MSHGFRGIDHLLDELVHGAPFAALVIIDEIPDKLRNILAKQFTFAVEILELTRYEDSQGQYVYHFEPFLEGVEDSVANAKDSHRLPLADLADVDTVLVPAREEGFAETFLGENRWYSIRLNGIMRPQLKWIGVYRTAPVSAITHIAPIHSIEPWEDTDKYVVNFAEPAKEITPIGKGEQLTHLQNIKYTTFERLQNAKTLDDL